MDYVGPFTYNGVRFALGSLTLAPLLLAGRGRSGPPPLPATGRLFILGGGALGAILFVAASLQQVALINTTAGKAGFITGLYAGLRRSRPFYQPAGTGRRCRLPQGFTAVGDRKLPMSTETAGSGQRCLEPRCLVARRPHGPGR
jgi:hypothetical protein